MSTVIATLPPCPDWCTEHTPASGRGDEGNVWHGLPFGSVEVADTEAIDAVQTVSVRMEQFERILDSDLVREDATVTLILAKMQWPLTAEQARAIGELLLTAADRLDAVTR